MITDRFFFAFLVVALLGFGCSTPVLRQDIPVSSNPMGAKIYADGQFAGQTPGTVSLERTKDHILTLVMDNYRQEDVEIRKQYQSQKVLMNAIQSGVNSGLFFHDTRMGVNSGFGSISRQEETGEAYTLVPPVVKVSLTPLHGPAPGSSASKGPPVGQSSAPNASPDPSPRISAKDALKAGAVAGAAVGAAQAKPIGKEWKTSSSSRTYTKPDGTRVTEKSGTSVGISVNPAGMVDVIDKLFK